MSTITLSRSGRVADIAPLVLRVGVGLVFALHGWQKFSSGPVNFGATTLEPLGVPAPEIVAWLMTVAEGVGGVLLIVGLLTRLATLPLIAIMVGAIVLVKTNVGFLTPAGAGIPGAELDTVLLAGAVTLLFLGPGRISLDAAIGYEHRVAIVRSAREPEPAGSA